DELLREPFYRPSVECSPAVVDPDIVALRPSELLEPLAECRNIGLLQPIALTVGHQHADAAHSIRLLRCTGTRSQGRRRAEQSEEIAAVHYSMTSSARSNTVCGIIRPSALAVSRLMTSSKRADRATGKSAGTAPFRMRPA